MKPLEFTRDDPHEERWRSEAGFFDARAADAPPVVGARVVARYAHPRWPWFNKEWRFRALGRLDGLHVLDVGSGVGDNAILLARAGARVVGVDVSPRSVEIAAARAAASGVRDAVRFVCAPIESAPLPARAFDVIWGDGVLHHVIPVLDEVLARLATLARPGARFVFSEPVNRVPLLRRVRLALPIPVEGTPGERPLEQEELAIIARHVRDLRVRSFSLVGRLNRFVLPTGFEEAPAGRRMIAHALCAADYAILSVPGIQRVGAMAVLHGHLGDAGTA